MMISVVSSSRRRQCALGEVGDEGARLHRDRDFRIERISVPTHQVREHHDGAIIGVGMRAAEIVAPGRVSSCTWMPGLFGSPTRVAVRLLALILHSIWSASWW
jgi:hypothetical protein